MELLRHRGTVPGTRRLRSALVALGVATAMLVSIAAATAAPANASAAAPAATATTTSSTDGTCPPSRFCLFEGTDFTGERLALPAIRPSGGCLNLSEFGWAGRASSVMNGLQLTTSMLSNPDCLSGPFGVPPGTSRPDLGTYSPVSLWIPWS